MAISVHHRWFHISEVGCAASYFNRVNIVYLTIYFFLSVSDCLMGEDLNSPVLAVSQRLCIIFKFYDRSFSCSA